MTPGRGIEPGPHWWEVSALITEPTLLPELLRSLSTCVFKARTATGRENFACQDRGVSQIFILIISNGEKILSKVNVVV